MLNFFKTKLAEFETLAAKYTDKETAEAIVAIMTGASFADGHMDDQEKGKLISALKINPILKQYDTSVLLAKHRELAEQLEFDIGIGVDACLKELKDVVKRGADESKRIAILKMGVASARANGDIGEAEREFLTKAAQELGLQLSQAGI